MTPHPFLPWWAAIWLLSTNAIIAVSGYVVVASLGRFIERTKSRASRERILVTHLLRMFVATGATLSVVNCLSILFQPWGVTLSFYSAAAGVATASAIYIPSLMRELAREEPPQPLAPQ